MNTTTTSNRLRFDKKRWDNRRSQVVEARETLEASIREAADGGMSQAEIGRILGWPRQRVHTLLED